MPSELVSNRVKITNWENDLNEAYSIAGEITIDDAQLATIAQEIKDSLTFKIEFDTQLKKLHEVKNGIKARTKKQQTVTAEETKTLNDIAKQLGSVIYKVVTAIDLLIKNPKFSNLLQAASTIYTPDTDEDKYGYRLSLNEDLLLSLNCNPNNPSQDLPDSFTIYDKKTGAFISAPVNFCYSPGKSKPEYEARMGFSSPISRDSSLDFPEAMEDESENLDLNFINLGKLSMSELKSQSEPIDQKYIDVVNSKRGKIQQYIFTSQHVQGVKKDILVPNLDF